MEIRNIYTTARDMSQRVIIDQAVDRRMYICQSQSMNLWVSDLDHNKMSAMYFYGWKKGLKTGQYYLRTRRAVNAKKITVTTTTPSQEQTSTSASASASTTGLQRSARGRRRNEEKPSNNDGNACMRDNPECTTCSS